MCELTNLITNNKLINTTSLDALAENEISRVCLAIGVFDGVHRGHQLLLEKLRQMAIRTNSVPVALTFYPHPRAVLAPERAPALLMPPYKRIEMLHNYGANAVVTISFSTVFASQTPEEFIRNCLHSPRIEIKGICVGSKWRFGAGGKGNIDLLRNFAQKGHFEFCSVPELIVNGIEVSSTAIRRSIASGRLDDTNMMLGRPYCLCGVVESGHKIAGRELNYPTANLKLNYGILPPDGVYAACAHIGGKNIAAAVNIGVSPTYTRQGNDSPRRVEVHIIEFNDNIYHRSLEVELLSYLREERCFSSPLELKRQIKQDIKRILQIM